jgi:hypothetical protein
MTGVEEEGEKHTVNAYCLAEPLHPS